jgi:hypothetical protein
MGLIYQPQVMEEYGAFGRMRIVHEKNPTYPDLR